MADWDPEANDLFLRAIELPAPEDRQRFLDEACAGNPELRARVDGLLRAGAEAGSFLERPLEAPALTDAHAPAPAGAPAGPPAPPGTAVGRYKQLEVIGEGGMGTVWLAEQTEPVRRKVALKVVKAGMDTRQVLVRFEAERQALSLMDHPNIARVLDAGATADGRPYFVMELVKGMPITRYCDDQRLPVRDRLRLFADLCRAVQHAHQKGVIHRDLKPSNVLVAPYDGKPVVKVIDFGVAKAAGQPFTDKTLFTGLGAVVGTPEYMSPEQAELNNADVDTRSDVYSLGVLLYELLTGTTPLTRQRLKEVALFEILRAVREEEPPIPSTRLSTADGLPSLAASRGTEPRKLCGVVRGELDWIVMRALEKDRGRRYDTANDLAQDVERYLADEAVEACPPSAAYRLRKFARRNRGRLVVAGLVIFFLVVLAGGAGWAAKDRTDRAQEARRQEGARRAALEADVSRGLDAARAFCRADRLPEAAAAVDQARALLAHGGESEELSRRVSGVRTEVDMAARLAAICLEQAAVKDGRFDFAGADSRYRDAFRDFGLDVTALDADAAAERIRASAIKDHLLTALHDWLELKSGPPDARLLAVLRRADSDPWRGRFRDAFGRGDRKALKDLARDPAALAQPPTTVVRLSGVLVGVGERPLAVDVLRAAQQQHPNDFWINNNLATYLKGLKTARPGETVGYYRAALALRPDSAAVHLSLGLALQDQGDLPGAVAEYQKAVALQPDFAGAHNNLGNALSDQGDLPGAVAEYQKAIAHQPDFAGAHYNLGNALHSQGDLAGAVAAYQKAVALQLDFAGAHYNLGNALRGQGDQAGAVAAYQKALALQPEYAEAHNGLGTALHSQGDLAGAVAECKKAIALQPEYAEAHFNLGNALRGQGDLAGAVAEYKKGVALQPDLAEGHYNLGTALRDQGDLPGAVAEYQKAVALKPENALAHYKLGASLHDQGDRAGAIAEYKKAVALQPDLAEAHYDLGLALQSQGEFQMALMELRRGDELGSRNPRWKYPSAEWVRRCERLIELDGRLTDFLDGKAAPAGPHERIELAELCYRKRQYRDATRFYEEAFTGPAEAAAQLLAANRYYAACAAALAGCGQDKDADQLDAKEKARLRGQALGWLQADLASHATQLASGKPADAADVQARLRRWLKATNFAGVRGPEALARLPEAERQPWQKLWADVADTLARAQARTTPEKKSVAK